MKMVLTEVVGSAMYFGISVSFDHIPFSDKTFLH